MPLISYLLEDGVNAAVDVVFVGAEIPPFLMDMLLYDVVDGFMILEEVGV